MSPWLFPEEGDDQGQENAQQDAGGKRKVKAEVSPLDRNVAGQPAQAQERKDARIVQDQPDDDEQNSECNEQTTERCHMRLSRVTAALGGLQRLLKGNRRDPEPAGGMLPSISYMLP